jgi:hypothetical protein
MDLKVSLFLLEKKSHGIQMRWKQEQGLRFVLLTPVLPAALPLMMGLMETSTASMGEILEVGGTRMAHLAPALPATLASVVQTVLSVQQDILDHLPFALLILVKPHQPPLTMGLMVTSTASMGGILAALQDLAPVLLATLGFQVLVVKTLIM